MNPQMKLQQGDSAGSAGDSMPEAVKRKRPFPKQTSAGNAQSSPVHCKICLQIFTEPFSTVCGHTFCRTCITQLLKYDARCPICDTSLDPKKTKIIPNHTVNALVEQIKSEASKETVPQEIMNAGVGELDEHGEAIVRMVLTSDNLNLSSIRRISEAVKRRQFELELDDEQIRNVLLHEFLERMIEKRELAAKQISSELERLKLDKQKIRSTLLGQFGQNSTQRVVPDSVAPNMESSTNSSSQRVDEDDSTVFSSQSLAEAPSAYLGGHSSSSATVVTLGLGDTLSSSSQSSIFPFPMPEQMTKYRRRLNKHMSSLETTYFDAYRARQQVIAVPDSSESSILSSSSTGHYLLGTSVGTADLDDFTQVIKGMSQYGDIRRLATLNYNLETSASMSIVSGIEFDKDGEYFAIAGVTKMIKLYDYNAVVGHTGDIHYPVEQLHCNSKISNISWNPYNKSLLASSDYDGKVQLWDTSVGKEVKFFHEHEKRCWTVQFNNVDPHLMASGSDDAKVKLWCVSAPQSIATIDAKVNVCCVYFSPQSRNHLVFGSADHCVHLYDIRNTSKALNIFRGHRKAVSYVKYCNETEVVSASTDSNLRLWDVNSGKCLQVMKGHQNERNFVGLSTDGNHVVCGSENNQLYLYYKGISEPLMAFDFSKRTVDTAVGQESFVGGTESPIFFSREQTTMGESQINSGATDFVSAVCWKKNSNVIVAANSQGTTHILQLL